MQIRIVNFKNKEGITMILTLMKESIKFAFGSLWGNKLRAFLSLLGIVIGVFSIILVLSAVSSLQKNVENSFNSLGSNVVFVGKWPWDGMGPDYPYWKYLKRPNPNPREIEYILERSSVIADIGFRAQRGVSGSHREQKVSSLQLMGVSHSYDKVRPLEISEGRYFNEQESRMGKNVTILGNDTKEALFGSNPAVGAKIRIEGKVYEVIGVLKPEGAGFIGGFNDGACFVPINNFKSLFNLESMANYSEIVVMPKEGIPMDVLKSELTGTMRGIRKLKPMEEDDFSLNETSILTQMTASIFAILNIVGWVIGMFSIFIGGFGVANIMFVSVKERTTEIGIQKSLGAPRKFILWQFLIESMVLSSVGGILGLVFVFITTIVITKFLGFDMSLNIQNATIGIFLSTLTGMIAGIVPAYSASKMDPVEAIRGGK